MFSVKWRFKPSVPFFRFILAKPASPPVPVAFAGTAFFIASDLVITCWHCVKQQLPSDLGYLALIMQEAWYADWLYNVSQDENGSDLATANLRGKPDFISFWRNAPRSKVLT